MTTSLYELPSRLNYVFKNDGLLKQSITHKSFHYENLQVSPGHNERLEFLGDAVLGLVIGALLMEAFPQDDEGVLSRKRAFLVSERGLAEVALEIGIDVHLILGRGEAEANGSAKPSILAGAFEALVGAVYLDGGFAACHEIIRRLFGSRVVEVNVEAAHDHKSKLQELVQEREKNTPQYRLLKTSGPDHEKQFEVGVYVAGQMVARASGKNKRSAEQEAARRALLHFSEENVSE